MKLQSFMNDNLPVQKGSVKIPIKGLIETYRDDYYKMKAIKKIDCTHTVYRMPDDTTIVHVKVPSGTVKNFYYDVLYELSYTNTTKDILDCEVKIFSNSPSFVYTYAYVFYHMGATEGVAAPTGMLINRTTQKIPKDRLLIREAEKKLGKEPLREPPVVRNVLGLPLFDKSLYFALFYLLDNSSLPAIRMSAKKTTWNKLLNDIPEFETLMFDRKKMERAQREKEAAKRKSIQKAIRKSELGVAKKNRVTASQLRPMKTSSTMSTSRTSKRNFAIRTSRKKPSSK